MAKGKLASETERQRMQNVRASTSKSSALRGVLFKGTKVYCSEVVNDTWVKIIWGGMGSSDAYVMAQYLVDGSAAPSSKRDRAIAIANSMKDANYPYKGSIGNLGLDAEKWCVQYCSWLMKAAGCSSSNYVPFSDALVSEAVTFFQNKGKFGLRANKVPTKGDWVFFSEGSETYQHVGLVVDVSGTNITTVEGNLSKTITSRGPSSYYGSFGDMIVYGFATPTWAYQHLYFLGSCLAAPLLKRIHKNDVLIAIREYSRSQGVPLSSDAQEYQPAGDCE